MTARHVDRAMKDDKAIIQAIHYYWQRVFSKHNGRNRNDTIYSAWFDTRASVRVYNIYKAYLDGVDVICIYINICFDKFLPLSLFLLGARF